MYVQEGGLWPPRVLHTMRKLCVYECHVEMGGNVYGEPSNCYPRSNGHRSHLWFHGQCATPRHAPDVEREGLETGGTVCPGLYREARTGGDSSEPDGSAPADRGGPQL